MTYLQVSLLGGSHDKIWWGQGIWKHSVLEFAKTESVLMVQWRFWTKYHTEPPTDKTIREWYKKFQQSGGLCTAKRTGRPGPWAETVERVQETFVRCPPKSTLRASQELLMPQSSVWHILCKHLCAKGYRLHKLDSLGWWSQPACSFRSAQAATLLEFLVPFMNCFVHRWFCVVLGPKPPLHHHNCLSFGKFQDMELFLTSCPRHVSSWLPPAVKPASMPWCLLAKQTWIDSLPTDMILSALCLSWLLCCRVQKCQRDLRITFYIKYSANNGPKTLATVLLTSAYSTSTPDFEEYIFSHC
jgi:hypothetical protein